MKQRCENKAQKSQIRSEVVVTEDKTKHDKGMKFLFKKYRFFAFIPRDSDSNFLATSPITVPDLERHNSSRKIPVIKYFLQILSKHYHYFRFSITFSEKNCQSRIREEDFPVGSMVKNPPANAGDKPLSMCSIRLPTRSIPDQGRPRVPQSNEAHEPQLLSLALEPEATTAEAHVP